MVHGQFIPGKFLSAIVTDTPIQFILPPLAFTQFFGPGPFPVDMFFIFLYGYPIRHHSGQHYQRIGFKGNRFFTVNSLQPAQIFS